MFKTTKIQFSSRASVKIGDSFFTFEAVIEKQADGAEPLTQEEYEITKQQLWEECHAEVDKQIQDVKAIV